MGVAELEALAWFVHCPGCGRRDQSLQSIIAIKQGD
jgi:hypothetical protein